MNIEKIRSSVAVAIIACAAVPFIIALSIFTMHRELFMSITWWMLLIISIGISFPCLLAIYLMLFFFEMRLFKNFPDEKKFDSLQVLNWTIAGIIASSLISINLFWLTYMAYSLRVFLIVIAIFHFALALTGILTFIFQKKRK
jgi:hypothetical protein